MPLVHVQDHVHPSVTEPGALVEAVLRSTRPLDHCEHVEHGALGRRAAWRQLEPNRLADPRTGETRNNTRCALLEATRARLAGDDDNGATRLADPAREHAPVEFVQPHAPQPPAGEQERQRKGERPRQRHHEERKNEDGHDPDTREIRQHEAAAERGGEDLWPAGHGATSPRKFSRRAGPMPDTASSSSTEPKPPCFCR